ncbi:MAG: ribulose-phosphate 3-epimerase [Planctomycetia bacterium]|nr:ribulose-phosphate 3-epimerase [Planctomycetia bacterium]
MVDSGLASGGIPTAKGQSPQAPVNQAAGHALDQVTARLDSGRPVVLPALLLCDFGHLAREVERLEEAGAAALHLDVMDGRFVPQLTYGLVVVEAVRRAARVPIEVHLMIEEPERSIADYARAGADILTVHVEGLSDPRGTLEAIAALGPKAHLAVSPGTPVERIVDCLDQCDGVLVMSVEPGYGGQAFNPVALEKLAELRRIRSNRAGSFRLGIDGGISEQTVAAAAAAGAELIVAGSAVIRSNNYQRSISSLEQLAREA